MTKIKIKKNCAVCGAEFIFAKRKNIHTCSLKCMETRKKKIAEQKERTCARNGCEEVFKIGGRQNNRLKVYCSRSCAAIVNNTGRKRIVVSLTDEERLDRDRKKREYKKAKKNVIRRIRRARIQPKNPYKKRSNFTSVRPCAECGKYHTKTTHKYCDICSPNIAHYRSRAEFKFNVYKFPDEFDLDLVAHIGWYSPTGKYGKNRDKMNLFGASRDHLLTIADGFKAKIDPSLLAHPANCEIVPHSVNASKERRKSRLTLDQLKERIAVWDSKHGEYEAGKI